MNHITILFSAFVAALLFSSCGGTSRTSPPPSGMGVIDTTPDPSRSDRISGMGIVSVNGQPASGDEAELSPGKNRVRVRFSWPQGGQQEADLDFKVKAGTIYVVYYDVHPPVSRHPGGVERATGGLLGETSDPYGAIVGALMAGFMAPVAAVEKVTRVSIENDAPANYVDLMTVAQKSPEGIVCYRRVHSDGSIEKR